MNRQACPPIALEGIELTNEFSRLHRKLVLSHQCSRHLNAEAQAFERCYEVTLSKNASWKGGLPSRPRPFQKKSRGLYGMARPCVETPLPAHPNESDLEKGQA